MTRAPPRQRRKALLERIVGSIAAGMSNSSSNSSSHCNVRRFISCVRLAFVTSVTYAAVGAARQFPHEKAVDRAEENVTCAGALADAGHLVQDPTDFEGAEVARRRKAGAFAENSTPQRARTRDIFTDARVLPDDGVVDGHSVWRSHTTVVSR